MPIINIDTTQTGQVGVLPSYASIQTSDPEATVLTTGYLNKEVANGASFSLPCIAKVSTQATPSTAPQVGWYQVVHVGSNWSLVPAGNPGDVTLPTIANHIATYTNTTGTLAEDPATAISGGNIQAGLSGTAGYLASFPATAAKGSFRVTAVANTNDTLTTLSNVAMGQASVVSIPDPANAIGRLLIGATATPFVSGNFPQNSGTGGLMVDSGIAVSALAQTANVVLLAPAGLQTITVGGLTVAAGNVTAGASGVAASLISFPATAANGTLILAAVNAGGAFDTVISNGTMAQSTVYTIPDVGAATGQFLAKTAALVSGNLVEASGTAGVCVDSGIVASNVQLKSQVVAATSADIGGAGAGPFTITVAGLTAASVVVATIETSSNAVAVAKATAGSGNFDILFTADPGAVCTVNYVAYIAAQ